MVEIMDYDETRKRIEENSLAEHIAYFIKCYRPRDDGTYEAERDRRDFESHLHSLILAVQRHAQEPVLKALTDLTMRMPMPSFVVPASFVKIPDAPATTGGAAKPDTPK